MKTNRIINELNKLLTDCEHLLVMLIMNNMCFMDYNNFLDFF